MNANLLRGAIAERGTDMKTVSNKIGLPPGTFYRKMMQQVSPKTKKVNTFTVNEAASILKVLDINDPEIGYAIFLS